jgi:hypothetical protein
VLSLFPFFPGCNHPPSRHTAFHSFPSDFTHCSTILFRSFYLNASYVRPYHVFLFLV